MAQGVFQESVKNKSVEELIPVVDSCGTGAYHEGSPPDSRTMWTLEEHGIELEHSARQLTAADYQTFDYILAMDRQNLSDIMHKKPKGSKAHIALFGSFARTKTDQVIKDSYYGSDNSGFDKSYEQCLIFTEGLIQHIQENHNA